MRVAIDKTVINKIKDFTEYEYIYIFDDESLEELLSLNMHCMNQEYCDGVEVNLTQYDIPCVMRSEYDKEDWKKEIKKNYKYAIIVPNYNNDHGDYNGKTYLRNCIESILKQTYKNFELIIVDDMSTDTSVETVESYVDNRIHLVKNKRKRYNGGSRNVGIEYALDNLDIDYFCFLDSDDWWINDKVLETIDSKLYGHEMALLGLALLDKTGIYMTKTHEYKTYEDFFLSDNKVWCTAWARVIRKDKIVYFCEDTLMEDRVWSYRQADNVNIRKVINIKDICYVWNRLNTSNSVSLTRGNFWNASAWCHIGHQLQFLTQLKHKDMEDMITERIEECMKKVYKKEYQQY